MGSGVSLSEADLSFPSASVVKTWCQDDVVFQLSKRGLADKSIRESLIQHADTIDGEALLFCDSAKLLSWGVTDPNIHEAILAALPKEVAGESGKEYVTIFLLG
jgi:hypothetical protein